MNNFIIHFYNFYDANLKTLRFKISFESCAKRKVDKQKGTKGVCSFYFMYQNNIENFLVANFVSNFTFTRSAYVLMSH